MSLKMKTLVPVFLSAVLAGSAGAQEYAKYFLNKESKKSGDKSPAFHDASYWNDKDGNPGAIGGELDLNGDYIVHTYRLDTDNDGSGNVPVFQCHSLTLGEVGGNAAKFYCYLSMNTKWSVGGEGLVLANGKVLLCWKPVKIDAKVTVTSPAENPFEIMPEYKDTVLTFEKQLVSGPTAGLRLYNSTTNFTAKLAGDYSQYLGKLVIGAENDDGIVRPNELILGGDAYFPGVVVLEPSGVLNVGSGSAGFSLGGLELKDGSTVLAANGLISVEEKFAVDGKVKVSLYLSAASVDALVARREYGLHPVLKVPAGAKVNAGNFVFELADANSRVRELSAVIASNHDGTKTVYCKLHRHFVYVKPDGDNGRSGEDLDNAWRTLSYAVSKFKDGVIYAAEGTYEEGLCDEGEEVTHSRVHVPAGVVLKALGSAEKTVIVGAKPTDATKLWGEGATRCVRLDSGAMIQGFTLTGGYGYASTVEVTGDRFANKAGGAVRGRGDSLVVDCIITNNIAKNGGGVQGGRYARCLFRGNFTIDDKGGKSCWSGRDGYGYGGTGEKESYSYFYDCLFDSREDSAVLVYNFCYLYNCTFTGSAYVSPQNYCELYNCIVPGSTLLGGGSVSYVNCLLGSTPNGAKDLEGSKVVEGWSTVLDEAGRPIAGGAAVDEGNNYLYENSRPAEAEPFDYQGGGRIYNGIIDIGCNEHDCRDAFGKKLNRLHATVIEASAGVKMLSGGEGLSITDGGALVLDFDASAKDSGYEIFFDAASDGGKLTICLDGDLWKVVDSSTASLRFPGGSSVRRLTFFYEGSGSATVGRFFGAGGVLILVR